jgi:CelD/BcsL family acetyltransferase involved in cellulose biosynthesis
VEFVTEHSDYNDMALGNDPAGQIHAILDFLQQTRDQWDLVDLRDIRGAGNTRALIESALPHMGLHYRISPEEGRCPYLPIDAGSATLMQRASGDFRRTLRKRMERAAALGLRTRIIENPQEELALLDNLIAVEYQKHLHGKLARPFIGRYRRVFQSLFDTLGPRHWIYVALLELNGKLAAWQLGFRCGKKLWDYNKAYDRTFLKFAPGTLLVAAVLDYGLSQDYKEYDFLRGEEPYKTVWSTGFHDRFRLSIWSKRWVSRTRAFVYLDFKRAVYRLLGRGQ